MTRQPLVTETKVLPFDCEQGHVPAHAILAYNYDWLWSPIRQVVIKQFDSKLEMTIEHVIHWTEYTKYLKRTWPKCGDTTAIILEDGKRIHVKSFHARHSNSEAYDRSPLLCRDVFKLTTLDSGHRLLEVAGVEEWLRSDRSQESYDRFVYDPFKR